MTDTTKARLRSVVTWLLTVGIAAAVAWAIDLRGLAAALRGANAWLLAAAVGVTVAGNLVVGPGRWQFILRRLGYRIPLKTATFVKIAGSPVKFALPMKSGELFRALYLNRQFGFNLERCVSSVLMEKVATLLAAGVFLVSGLLIGNVQRWRWEALIVTAVLLAVFASRGGQRLVSGVLGRISARLSRGFGNLVSALAELSPGTKLFVLLYSLMFVLTEMTIGWLSFRALGMAVSPLAFFVFIPVSVLASIPTFSGIGTREAAAVWFFGPAGLFPIADSTPAMRVAGALLITTIYYLFVPVAGLPFVSAFLHRSIWKRKNGTADTAAESPH